MDATDKVEATAFALERLALADREHDVIKALRASYGCSGNVARNIFHRAITMLRESIQLDADELRGTMEKRIDALYRLALQQTDPEGMPRPDLATCRDLLKYLGRIWGVEQPTKKQVEVSKSWLDGRSADELDFYASHGCWPEEAPDELRATMHAETQNCAPNVTH